MTNPVDTTADDFEPVSPAEARRAIEATIVERLGEHYDDEWMRIHNGDYLVRLHKGDINLDFQCDLLGNVEVIERDANPIQLSGRLIVGMVLAASFLLALVIASVAGVF